VLTQITERIDKPASLKAISGRKTAEGFKKPLISTGEFTYHRSKGASENLTPAPSLLLINEARLLTAQRAGLAYRFGRCFGPCGRRFEPVDRGV
jgi:hypothetical protein